MFQIRLHLHEGSVSENFCPTGLPPLPFSTSIILQLFFLEMNTNHYLSVASQRQPSYCQVFWPQDDLTDSHSVHDYAANAKDQAGSG